MRRGTQSRGENVEHRLYDGIVQHKILQLHPVREGAPNQLPYDLVFNGLR
jgi:uncharacterized membrane protein